MFCRKCGAPNRDDAMFCEKCGQKIVLYRDQAPKAVSATEETPIIAETPDIQINQEHAPSESTVAVQEEEVVDAEITENPVTDVPAEYPEKKRLSNNLMTRIGIAIIVAIICIIGAILLPRIFSREINKEELPVIYRKNDEIIIRSADGEDVVELDSGIFTISKNGERILYKDGNAVYATTLSDSNEKFKIGSDTKYVTLSPNGKYAAYSKRDSNELKDILYITDFKDTWKIEEINSDENFSPIFSDNEEYIFFRSSGTRYIRETKKNGKLIKLGKNVNIVNPWTSSSNGSHNSAITYSGELYYRKDGDLYYKKKDNPSVKVLSDTYDLFGYVGEALYVSGEDGLYYIDGGTATKLSSDRCWITNNFDDELFLYNHKVSEKIYMTSDHILTTDGRLLKLPEEYSFTSTSKDGKYVYCETYDKDLVRYEIKSDGVGKKEKIASNVLNYIVSEDHDVFVITEFADEYTFLTYDGKLTEIDEMKNISHPSIEYEEDGTVYFTYDKNDKNVLVKYIFGDDEFKEIADDVKRFDIRSANMCYYVANNKLYLKDGDRSPVEIDEDVEDLEWNWTRRQIY